MTSAQRDLPIVYLKPGEMHCTDQPTLVVTVLGSCLSITLFSNRLRLGAICHSMLPGCPKRKTCTNGCREKFKYIDCAIPQMVNLFERMGASRDELEVKYFGGADMLPKNSAQNGFRSIGSQNSGMAELIIRRERLTLVAKDAGGLRGRKVLFYTESGDVLLKRLATVNDPGFRW